MKKIPIYGSMKMKNGNLQLIKEATIVTDELSLAKPKEIANFVNKYLDLSSLAEEQFWILALNAQIVPLGLFRVSQGGVAESTANTAGIFKRLLLTNAYSFVAIHNHPSGSTLPSADDIATTKNLKNAADMLGIHLLDHVIIGEKKYTSIRRLLNNQDEWE